MKTSTILKRAKRLISKPEKWTKGNLARDAAGDECPATEARAVCWCAEGAIAKVTGGQGYTDLLVLFESVLSFEGERLTPWQWNDAPRRTHDQVLKAFDRAIAKAEAAERAK